MPIIELSNLSKFYGSVRGIENLSLTVQAGEVFGFLGPNGAGKTTTIRLLLQLLYPSGGTISLFGKPPEHDDVALREKIGYLPGEFSPYANMQAGAFLDYLARFRRRRAELRPFLLEKLQLHEQDLQTPIKHLSHGNRQKLGIVSALEHLPDLAVLDEPTIGLDPLMQEAFFAIIAEFQARGKTIFLSSHILNEVERVCQRVAIIRQGKLVALETLAELRGKRPRRLIVAFSGEFAEGSPSLPNTRLLERNGNRMTYLLTGEIQPVLQELAKYPILDLVLPAPDLEDIFMAYYQEARS